MNAADSNMYGADDAGVIAPVAASVRRSFRLSRETLSWYWPLAVAASRYDVDRGYFVRSPARHPHTHNENGMWAGD